MRDQIEHRPAFVGAMALVVGLATAHWLPAAAFLLAILVLLKTLQRRAIAVTFFALGVFLWPGLPSPSSEAKREVDEIFTVTSMPRAIKDGLIAEIINDTGQYRIVLKQGKISLGDNIRVKGVMKGVSEVQEPYFRAKGLQGSITVNEAKDIQIVHEGPLIFRLGLAWRESFLRFSEQSLPAGVSDMADALCFNVDGELPEEFRDNLQRTGTIHIISASGLHVFLFSLAVQFLLAFLPMPRWMQFILLILVLLLYSAAAGFRPPVVRAAFMGIAYMGSEFCKRVPDALSSLSLAAIIYLLWKPLTLLDIGFQLSFVAVFALAYFRLHEKSTIEGLTGIFKVRIGHLAWQSLVATGATAPLVAYHFGLVSVIAVLANLLIAAAILPIMVGSVVGWLFSFLLPAVSAGILAIFVTPFVGWISWVVNGLGSLSFAAMEIPAFNALWLVPIYAALIALWRPRVRQA
ncbi:MAG: ComEC/Rec2 family competence protein [Fimbriimonadaceae bacterium]|nr:ComEC/Rec2 family competence protein [Fimbriimonadaceae bacterium]